MMRHLTPGIYADIPDLQYHADELGDRPSLSNSIAKQLLRSPLHAWTSHPKLNPNWEPVDSKVFDTGRAAHRAVLGKGADYVGIPDDMLSDDGGVRTKIAKAWVQEAREAGLTPLKSDEIDLIETMAVKLRMRLEQYGITVDPDFSEMTALAEIDGVLCRCRVDNAPDKMVNIPGIGPRKVMIDFKTCEDASPDAVRRAVENNGYDFQDRHYAETWQAASGEDRVMVFVFQEKKPPNEVGVACLLMEAGHSADWSADAAEKVAVARALWNDCLTTNNWPGYPDGILTIGARPFYRQAWADRADFIAQTNKPSRAALHASRAAQAPETHRLAGE